MPTGILQEMSRTYSFENFFILSAVIEWNKLDINLRCSNRLSIFKKNVLEVMFGIK